MATETKEGFIRATKEVVSSLLADLGLATDGISATTCPHKIKEFDSPIALLGSSMLAGATGIDIPLDENIFHEKKGNKLRTIEEVADRLVALQAEQARRTRRTNGEVGVAS